MPVLAHRDGKHGTDRIVEVITHLLRTGTLLHQDLELLGLGDET